MLLLCAATEMELAPFKKALNNPNIAYLITGVGLVNSTYRLTSFLHANKRVSSIINVGICGIIGNRFSIGDVIHITNEILIDFGAETKDDFESAFDWSFAKNSEIYDDNGCIEIQYNKLFSNIPKVKSITSNIVHGNSNSIFLLQKNYLNYAESMEGWAIAYVAKANAVPLYSIKAISNYVEIRNKEKWNIDLALQNLCNIVCDELNKIR